MTRRQRLSFVWTVFGLASTAFAQTTHVEGFEEPFFAPWTWGTGGESVSPLNGNPGAYLQDLTLASFNPFLSTVPGSSSVFTGDYRSRGVTELGVDLLILDTSFGVSGRFLTVALINDNGTPFSFEDDFGAFFIGPDEIPTPGVDVSTGWNSYTFEVPSQADAPAPGWTTFDQTGLNPVGFDWVGLMSDVDQAGFYYGDPTRIYLLNSWDVGADNVRITEGAPACPADLAEPVGQLDFSDVVAFLSAFGSMDPVADFAEPFGQFDFSDVVAFLSAFGAGCP